MNKIETIKTIQVINETIKVATIFPSSFQDPMNYTPVDIYNKEKIKRYWIMMCTPNPGQNSLN